MSDVIRLDGLSLTRTQLVAVAHGAAVALDAAALVRVARAADFLAAQVDKQEPIYGVSTGFGSNADKLLGAHRLRDELPGAVKSGQSPHIELQRNLIITHAVYFVARAFRHSRANPASAGQSAQCRHRAGGAAAGLGGCIW